MDARACVLVVDDDEAIRDTLRLVLEDADYRVEEAPDGTTALDRMRTGTERYIVLLDLIMPGMDGAAVLAGMASDSELFARHAYILMTAGPAQLLPEMDDLRARLNIPVLQKPFDLDILLGMLADARKRLA